MKKYSYQNVILTLICLCLITLTLQSLGVIQPLRVNIRSIGHGKEMTSPILDVMIQN